MKKIFISQPMSGLTDEQILGKRERIKEEIKKNIKEEVEIIDSFIEGYPGEINKHIPVWYLGHSILRLSEADIVYFSKGWSEARGCKIEYQIAVEYGLEIIVEY